MDDMDVFRTVALGMATLGQAVFTSAYLLLPWRVSPIGRALFFKACALLLILVVAFASRVFPDVLRNNLVFTSLYLILGVGIWAQVFAFLASRAAVTHNMEMDEECVGE